jgi:Sulfatase
MARDQPRRDHTESLFDRFAALVVLTVFGLTWPILDLLGRNAEFFLARRSPKGEIVVLALVAVVLAPVAIGALGSLPGRPGRWLGLVAMVVAGTSLAHLYLAKTGLPWWLALIGAVVTGLMLTWSFTRFASVRQAGRYLLVAPLVVLGVFLFTMPVGAVLREPDVALGNPVAVESPVPVVLLVFDEFPVADLMDGEGNLRSDRYPNFARLAADGTWFRNAVTVEQQTEHSVPAILTGSVPQQSLVPVAGQYPFNLFTALRSTYDLHVVESITQLCPRALCEQVESPIGSLVGDVSVVAGHVLLPEPMTEELPAIDRGWGDFQTVAGDFDAKAEFRDLLSKGQTAAIDATLDDMETGVIDGVPLFYMHAIVPHHPWQFLPDGRSYPFIVEANPASVEGGWGDDEFLVAQSMQRHLLQVGYVDHVVGQVIEALQTRGLYDDSLMIVVADHGIAIYPGVPHQRIITEATIGDIAAVPLFVKLPHDGGGVIDDRRALTIDVLPTIADVIGATLPDEVEGVSLLAAPPDRTSTTTHGPTGDVTFGVEGREKLTVARRIEGWFPDGDPWALRPDGAPDLVGTTIDSGVLRESSLRVRLKDSALYEEVDTHGPVIPSRIGGTVYAGATGDEVLAVTVNGVVGSVTRAYRQEGTVSFLAMVPPTLFHDGDNVVEVLHVTSGGLLERLRD